MIENVETYDCEVRNCGRKFQTCTQLMEHYKRRHVEYYLSLEQKDNLIDDSCSNMNKSQMIFHQLYRKIDEFEKDCTVLEDDILEYSNHEENHQEIDQDQIETKKMETTSDSIFISQSCDNSSEIKAEVTDEMIGIGRLYADYDEIEEVNLEGKNLGCFRDKRNINFRNLLFINSLNLSKNFIRDISQISVFTGLISLNLSNNKISDISVLENFCNLEFFYAERNDISFINSLVKCKKIKTLHLSHNKISYETSTYKTLESLEKLKDLTMLDNPFLIEKKGVKHIFIHKYPKLTRFENEEISDVERDLALQFIRKTLNEDEFFFSPQEESTITNIKLVKPENIRNSSSDGKDNKNNQDKNKTLTIVNNKIITRVSRPSTRTQTKSNHPLLKNQLKANNSNNTNNSNNMMNDISKKEIEELRIENKQLADTNKSYEMEISSLKLEIESLRNLNKEFEGQILDYKRKLEYKTDREKKNLKNECELWKREYVDLLDKSMSTNVSTSRMIKTNDNLRPQTAKLIRKNSLDESSESLSDKEEDAEIDEMLRKSVTNLEQLKSRLKVINNATAINK